MIAPSLAARFSSSLKPKEKSSPTLALAMKSPRKELCEAAARSTRSRSAGVRVRSPSLPETLYSILAADTLAPIGSSAAQSLTSWGTCRLPVTVRT